MLYSYSFTGVKNGETYVKTSYTSFSAIAFMMDCLSCAGNDCSVECKSDRFLRELEDRGEATMTEVVDADVYTSHAWRNEP